MNLPERTHYAGEIRKSHVGQSVCLMGWVRRRRDLGSLVFVDLRDREGIVQIVFSEDLDAAAFAGAHELRPEFVILVRGTVRLRGERDVNPHMQTGAVEVAATFLEVLAEAETPPFAVEDEALVSEEMRLQYRYLDLRRPFQNARLVARHRLTRRTREFLSDRGFIEIETPFLTKSTPEGARDFLVPSRLRRGSFYALPQSPQLFKQLCMVSGFDRYFQVVRCFRDEDLRADRQLEFTQIDIEMSFATQERVMAVAEGLILDLFEEVGWPAPASVPRVSYREAMERYGCDKPDTRFGMELKTVSGIAGQTSFGVFRSVLDAGGVVRGISVPGQAGPSRKQQEDLNGLVKPHGGKGVVTLWRKGGQIAGPALKHLGDGPAGALLEAVGAGDGDLGLFVADGYDTACACLSALRLHFAKALGLLEPDRHDLLWVHRFPMFEWSAEEGRWAARHHPFTMPRPEDWGILETDPGAAEALAYDLVLDGNEIGGGSIRIHRGDVQRRVFKVLGFSEEQAQEKFGFLLDAFRFGTPPHGGIAFGLDRLAMILLGCESIRDVIAFPKTTSGLCLMTGSPGTVEAAQLDELGVRLRPGE
ncbi:MAG: aspartate--tRNA ligase [Acidobacteriota bacterium]